jgi:hypothetical protein
MDEGALKLLQDSVCANTRNAYKTVWPRWKTFLHQFFDVARDSALVSDDMQYLPYNWSTAMVSNMIHMFAWFLFALLALKAANVKQHLTALKYQFITRRCNAQVFDWAELTTICSGLTRQPISDAHISKRRLPFSMSMVRAVYKAYANSRHLSQRANAVAVVLGFCCLLRPSEYLVGTQHDDHVLRASDFELKCRNTGMVMDRGLRVRDKGTSLVQAHHLHTVRWEDVVLVRIYMDTAKNFRVGRALWFSVGTSIQSFYPVQVLYDWILTSAPRQKDFILSWPTLNKSKPGQRTSLRYKDFMFVVKHAAVQAGFAPNRFGCQGLRVGGATLLRAAGATDEKICLMGRWKSLPACLGYQEVSTATHDRMLDMLLRSGAYTDGTFDYTTDSPRYTMLGLLSRPWFQTTSLNQWARSRYYPDTRT